MAGSSYGRSIGEDSKSIRIGLDAQDKAALQENDIQTTLPAQIFRLRYLSVACLVINTMIGTGIFNTPSIIMANTQSQGITLLLWLVGGIYALAAAYLYRVVGLCIPRMDIAGTEIGVPRSGGELNYMRYILDSRGNSNISLPACIFGISFVLFAHVSGNTIAFGQYAYAAAGRDPTNAEVRGVAIIAATVTCVIHSLSRRGGIWLSNALALFKVAILMLIIIMGFCAYRGAFGRQDATDLGSETAFTDVASSPFGYANAFLHLLFAYGGWNQVNMVLGEVKDPRRKFKRSLPAAVILVFTLYMLVNVVWMLVVPKEIQASQNTALAFFERTLGRVAGIALCRRLLNAFMAVSSLGTIIVITFTAARVKQELAKTGSLPWAKFFGSGYDLSWRRLLKMIRGRHTRPSTLQETPVGSLVLHWLSSVLTLLLTWPLEPASTYSLLIGINSYLFVAFFPTAIALGVAYFHLNPRIDWNVEDVGFKNYESLIAAVIVATVGLFPLIMEWVPPSGPWDSDIPWYSVPLISWTILFMCFLYWLWMRYMLPKFGHRQGRVLLIERDPHFSQEDGYPVLDHEIVRMRWIHKSETHLEFRTSRMQLHNGLSEAEVA